MGAYTSVVVAPGSGLTGGGESGGVRLGIDTRILQRRVASICNRGYSIREIEPSGFVSCEKDDIGFNIAGIGLQNSGNEISVSSLVARKDAAAGNQAFDTSTLYLDYTNNRVGINDSTPLTTLDVDGTTSASRYVYRTARAYSQYISAVKFNFTPYRKYDGSERFEYNYYSGSITPYAYGEYSHLITGIHLPQGANISRLTCYYSDNSEIEDIQSITASLTSRGFLASNRTTLGSISATTSGNNPNIIQNADISVFGQGDPIDNRHFMYLLEMELALTENTSGENFSRYSNIKFYGCRIDYELKEVAP